MLVEVVNIPAEGRTLRGALHLPHQSPWAICILSHGLLSHKGSPKFVGQADRLARAGIAALRYDHMGCGESGGDIADTTVASRLEDLESACAMMRRRFGPDLPLGLGGSSMGGFISLLHASNDERVGALALWATPAFIRSHPNKTATAGGELIGLPDAGQYDLREVAPRAGNALVIHGKADTLVPAAHAQQIYERLSEPKRLALFPDACHRFLDEESREEAIRCTVRWFVARLWGRREATRSDGT